MSHSRILTGLLLSVAITTLSAHAEDQARPVLQAKSYPPAQATTGSPVQESSALPERDIFVTVGKSFVVDSAVNIQRVSVANGDLAEAVAITPREVLVNGKAPGETSLIIWQQGGNRLFYNLAVRQSTARIDAVRNELRRQLPGEDIKVDFENDTAFLSGTVNDMVSAQRAADIAKTLGKLVNLLKVKVPPVDAQILLKVRFANVDRSATTELGANLFSTGATNTLGATSTGQFTPPQVQVTGKSATFNLSDALNVFLFRPDLNLGATIKALQSKNMLQILAEPNVLAIDGKQASFLAGGEFPFPTLQGGGAGLGAVTIQFRQFGVRINFLPRITPRGTIRLEVAPEVSSLDFANGLVFQGFNIPALSTRRVQTEIELESGQSFAIAGLLDNRMTESMSKIPGIGDIPILGKLFQSKSFSRNNTELLVMVTPELVRPIPAGYQLPSVKMPVSFMPGTAKEAPRTPGMDVTGKVPVKPKQETIPVEQLEQIQKQEQGPSGTPALPPVQFVPVPVTPSSTPQANPGLTPTPMPPSSTGAGASGK